MDVRWHYSIFYHKGRRVGSDEGDGPDGNWYRIATILFQRRSCLKVRCQERVEVAVGLNALCLSRSTDFQSIHETKQFHGVAQQYGCVALVQDIGANGETFRESQAAVV